MNRSWDFISSHDQVQAPCLRFVRPESGTVLRFPDGEHSQASLHLSSLSPQPVHFSAEEYLESITEEKIKASEEFMKNMDEEFAKAISEAYYYVLI